MKQSKLSKGMRSYKKVLSLLLAFAMLMSSIFIPMSFAVAGDYLMNINFDAAPYVKNQNIVAGVSAIKGPGGIDGWTKVTGLNSSDIFTPVDHPIMTGKNAAKISIGTSNRGVARFFDTGKTVTLGKFTLSFDFSIADTAGAPSNPYTITLFENDAALNAKPSGSTASTQISIFPNGNVGAGGTGNGSGSATIATAPVGKWYRVDAEYDISTSKAAYTVKNGADVVKSISNIAFTVPANGFSGVRIDGTSSALPTATLYINNLRAFEGAAAGEVSPPAPVVNPAASVKPVITHTPLTSVSETADAAIIADIANAETDNKVYYKYIDDSSYRSVSLVKGTGNTFTAAIPKGGLAAGKLTYYIEAKNTAGTDTTAVYNPTVTLATKTNYNSYPKLLITDIMVQTDSYSGYSFAYQYIKVYNNTSAPIDLADYAISYSSLGRQFTFANNSMIAPRDFAIVHMAKPIDPDGTFTNANKVKVITPAIFNAYYGIDLGGKFIQPINYVGTSDFSTLNQSTAGTISILPKINTSTAAEVIVQATYTTNPPPNRNKPECFTFPTSGNVMLSVGEKSSSGITDIYDWQVPSNPVSVVAKPVITHVPLGSVLENANPVIEAAIIGENVTANLYYKYFDNMTYKTLPMTNTNGDTYTAAIPKAGLAAGKLTYYITATNIGGKTTSNEHSPIVYDTAKTDYNNYLPIMITEVMVQTNKDAQNGYTQAYQYIKVYNNTDVPIDLKNYVIAYTTDYTRQFSFKEDTANPSKPQNAQNTIIAPKDYAVIHMARSAANGTFDKAEKITLSMFNAYYGTNIDESHFIKPTLFDKGNGGDFGTLSTTANQYLSILPYPSTPLSSKAADVISQVYYTARADAATSADNLKTPEMYTFPTTTGIKIMTSVGENATALFDKPYSWQVPAKPIKTGNAVENIRVNYDDGDFICKTTPIIAATYEDDPYDVEFYIDDSADSVRGTVPSLERPAKLYFDVRNTTLNHKNTVTMGENNDIIFTFTDANSSWKTYVADIDPKYLTDGSGNKVTFRRGNWQTAFPDINGGVGINSYDIQNVYVVLNGDDIATDKIILQSSSVSFGTAELSKDFSFFINENKLHARRYDWDTTEVADGEHTVKITSAKFVEEKVILLIIDNTAPVITVNGITDNATLGGIITAGATYDDGNGIGVDYTSVAAKLNGSPVTLPITISKNGDYNLYVEICDKLGNKSTQGVNFKVVNPVVVPNIPNNIVKPGDSVTLSVEVTQPTSNAMNVSFYEAYKYNTGNLQTMKAYKGNSLTEPPTAAVPSGEAEFSRSEYKMASEQNGQYVVSTSEQEFPYHRFEVNVADDVKNTDIVAFKWKGRSVGYRKISLFAWNYSKGVYEELDSKVTADETSFELCGSVLARDYVRDNKIIALVQDPIPAIESPIPTLADSALADRADMPYLYSFAWTTDPQNLVKYQPAYHMKNIKWLVDNKDALNLKYVMNTGDLVCDSGTAQQWVDSDKAQKQLDDAKIPNGVLAGNHDTNGGTYSGYKSYYGENRYKANSWYGGSYDNNFGHYDLISEAGTDFIMLYMSWMDNIPSNSDKITAQIAWMNEVLKKYPNRKAILLFHDYLESNESKGRSAIGDRFFAQVVEPNENVIMVLCGHTLGTWRRTITTTSGRKVYELVFNYQGQETSGGDGDPSRYRDDMWGFIRILQMDPAHNKIHFRTYSPINNSTNIYDRVGAALAPADRDQFSLDFDFAPMLKKVATDYFELSVYTDNLLGTLSDVASGTNAAWNLNNYEIGKNFGWYVIVTDDNNGKTNSDVYGFRELTVGENGVAVIGNIKFYRDDEQTPIEKVETGKIIAKLPVINLGTEAATGLLMLAQYNKDDGKLINIVFGDSKMLELNTSVDMRAEIRVEIAEGTIIKALLWKDMETMHPLVYDEMILSMTMTN